jgi:hypothetical protein
MLRYPKCLSLGLIVNACSFQTAFNSGNVTLISLKSKYMEVGKFLDGIALLEVALK